MMERNLTHTQCLDLFGKGMGLLTVGAAGLVVGVQGPLSGQLALLFLTLSTPLMAAGALCILLPAVVPIQTDGIESKTDSVTDRLAETVTTESSDRPMSPRSFDD